MKTTILILVITLLFVLIQVQALAYEPIFKAGVKIQADGSAIDVKENNPLDPPNTGQSVPEVSDWNGDGRKDLLVGQFDTDTYEHENDIDEGRVRLYLNSGTDSEPVFTLFRYLEADGEVLAIKHY